VALPLLSGSSMNGFLTLRLRSSWRPSSIKATNS
jgi:hypothetical protein